MTHDPVCSVCGAGFRDNPATQEGGALYCRDCLRQKHRDEAAQERKHAMPTCPTCGGPLTFLESKKRPGWVEVWCKACCARAGMTRLPDGSDEKPACGILDPAVRRAARARLFNVRERLRDALQTTDSYQVGPAVGAAVIELAEALQAVLADTPPSEKRQDESFVAAAQATLREHAATLRNLADGPTPDAPPADPDRRRALQAAYLDGLRDAASLTADHMMAWELVGRIQDKIAQVERKAVQASGGVRSAD